MVHVLGRGTKILTETKRDIGKEQEREREREKERERETDRQTQRPCPVNRAVALKTKFHM